MTKTKLTLSLAFIVLSGTFLLLGTLLFIPTVRADHGLNSGQCAEEYGTSGSQFDLCSQHARVDRDIAACQQAGGTPDNVERCIDNIRAASDGYPHGEADGGDGQGSLTTGFDDSFSDPEALCSDPVTGDPIPNCNLKDCNGVLISIDVDCAENENAIMGYLAGVINFLSFGIALIIVAVIVVAGGQYIHAKGNPQQVEEAKSRITNAILALVVYIFLYAILNWLVPGGLFG